MTTPPRRVRAGLAMAAAVLLVGSAGTTSAAGTAVPTTISGRPTTAELRDGPSTFVSVRSSGSSHPVLAVSDARSGRILRTLHNLPWDGMTVSGTAVDREGRIWVTLDRGPVMADDTAGGDPQARSCGSQVIEIDPSNATTRTILRGGDDELISDAQPSPDGRRLAYLHTGCARSYFVNEAEVRDLATGRTLTIGSALPACHALFGPRWTADGRRLVLVYGAATEAGSGAPSERLGYGICNTWEPPGVTIVDADRSQPGLSGATVAPDPGCQISAATPTAGGLAAIEQCGTPPVQSGDHRVLLIRYGPDLAPLSSTDLGACGDGSELRADLGGSNLLVSSYQYCNPPGTTAPATRLFTVTAPGLRQVTSAAGGDDQFADLSW